LGVSGGTVAGDLGFLVNLLLVRPPAGMATPRRQAAGEVAQGLYPRHRDRPRGLTSPSLGDCKNRQFLSEHWTVPTDRWQVA
jgi:hypothetical protein